MSSVIMVHPLCSVTGATLRPVPASRLCPGHEPGVSFATEWMCRTSPPRCKMSGMTSLAVIDLRRWAPDSRAGSSKPATRRSSGTGHPRRPRSRLARASAATSPAEAARTASGLHGRVGPRGAASGHRRPGRHRRRGERVDHGDRDVDGRTPGGALAGDRLAGGGPAGRAGPRQPVRGRVRHAPRVRRRPAPSRRTVHPSLGTRPPSSWPAPSGPSGGELVANASLVGTLALFGETIALADRLGLGRRLTMDILAKTPSRPGLEEAA